MILQYWRLLLNIINFTIRMEAISTDSVEQVFKFVEEWKEKDAEDLLSSLQQIKNMNIPHTHVPKAKQIINQFHRQLIAAGDIEEKVLSLVFEVKEHIKKLEDKTKGKLPPQPKIQKRVSVSDIQVPKNYGNGLLPNRKSNLHFLYKHFIFNIKEQQNHPKLEKFLVDVECDLFKISQGNTEIYNKQVKKICQHFVADSCKSAKLRMLQGQILPKDVALNKSEAFLSDEARQKIQQNIKQESIFTNVNFFDEHRRKIHSTASEECRFCKSKNAYCWSMKQIRAADQPMTRFMKCQKCDREWKD